MVTLFYWMLLLGSLVAVGGGLLLLVKGDALRAADLKAGRTNVPDPQAMRKTAKMILAIGVVGLLLAFFAF
ncbi:hypothetical protein ACBY01_14135 [Sphingomonas sp. ac-8]|uniref:hypothetical protein n=1 Tax=Sphingomonas sp. ac-8 TaxID=3242977 RepID=UPI003A7FC532